MDLYPALPVGSTPGLEPRDNTYECPAGGWILSANELYKISLDLLSGNKLLTNSEKAEMNADCLGWDCSVGPQKDFIGKNGGFAYDYDINKQTHTYAISTFIGIFKGSVPLVLIFNSALGENITGVVTKAFRSADVPHP